MCRLIYFFINLYCCRNIVRYDYTHEVLSKEESKFKSEKIEKKRRISIICRNEPSGPEIKT